MNEKGCTLADIVVAAGLVSIVTFGAIFITFGF
jgi:hypothetical protein